EVGAKADDSFYYVVINQTGTHLGFFITEEDTVRKEYSATPGTRLEAGDDVLEEGIVCARLWWGSVDIAAVRMGGPSFGVPLFDRVGRIRQDYIELAEAVAVEELGFRQGVAALDAEILDAMEKEVHAGDGGGHKVTLLPVEFEGAKLFPQAAKLDCA